MKLSKTVLLLSVFLVFAGCKRVSKPTAPPAAVAKADQIAAAQALVEKSPSFENYLALGMAFSGAGRHEDALTAFEKTLSINPKSPIALNNVCYEYNSLNKWALGIENCQKALDIEPTFTLAKNNLAYAKKTQEAHAAKIVELKHKISAGKEIEKSRLDLGMAYYTEGNYEDGVDQWKQISKESAHFATAQNNMASAYIILKKFDLAKTSLDRAIELQPKNQLFLNNRGWLRSASQAKAP